MDKRKTDTEPDNITHFRAGSRIFRLNNEWWFATREGEQGPFATERAAALELATYIKLMGLPEDDSALEIIEEPELRPANPKVWDQFDNFN